MQQLIVDLLPRGGHPERGAFRFRAVTETLCGGRRTEQKAKKKFLKQGMGIRYTYIHTSVRTALQAEPSPRSPNHMSGRHRMRKPVKKGDKRPRQFQNEKTAA